MTSSNDVDRVRRLIEELSSLMRQSEEVRRFAQDMIARSIGDVQSADTSSDRVRARDHSSGQGDR